MFKGQTDRVLRSRAAATATPATFATHEGRSVARVTNVAVTR